VNLLSRIQTLVVAAALTMILPTVVRGQGELRGRVLSDSGGLAITRAEVSIPRLGLSALSDSAGRYRLQGIPAGDHQLITRVVGFRPDTSLLEMDDGLTIVKDFALRQQIQTLAPTHVTAPEDRRARLDMVGFTGRREKGVGRFLDRATFERLGTNRTSTVLATVLKVLEGRNGDAWAASTRALNNGQCVFCPPTKRDPMDSRRGATSHACYMDVYVDGMIVFDSARPEAPLFNLNSLRPAEIEGVEVYAGGSQMPPEYNQTSGGCGVLLIWTRR
jgi:hypothetical protein